MNILVTMPISDKRNKFLTPFSISSLEALGNVTYNPYDRNYTTEELKEAIKGKDVVFSYWPTPAYDEEILEAADSLKIIAYCEGSIAGVATPEVYEKGIAMLSANTVYAESVAEGCLCYTLAGLRRVLNFSSAIRQGGWREENFYDEGILDRTIGLVGFGAIAKKFVEFIKPFRNRVLVCSRHLTKEEAEKYGVELATLEEIFEKSDVVSIHQGLNEQTYHMVKREHLDLMKDGSLLVNTARGAVIDEKELIEVLKTGRINAVLDVFEEEPPAPDSILRKLSNVTLMPHRGGPTVDRRPYCVVKLIEDIKKLLSGESMENLDTYIPFSHVKNMTNSIQFKK